MLEAEKQLIERARLGDSDSFGRLYDHYGPAIYRFIAIRVTVREEAEDLTHEVFLSAWQKLPTYKERGFPFGSWLYRIARNRVIDYWRTKKIYLSLDDPEQEIGEQLPDENSSSPASELDTNISLEEIKSAIKDLSPNQQDVLILRFVEDLSPAEIAKILNKREGTIRILQFRAIKSLKRILAKRKK